MSPPAYRLVRTPVPPLRRLTPDPAQERVISHASGPLLVLAGPGTGKTSTLVEAVARRVEAGLQPDEALVLTFSRRAAEELRERIGARLGRTGVVPAAWTFHAFCYALLREHQDPDAYTEPLRLLSGPEQDVMLRELLRGSLDLDRDWPPVLRDCLTTRGLAEEVHALLGRVRELGLDPDDLLQVGRRAGREDWTALAGFFGEYLDVLGMRGAVDYGELVHRAVLLAERPEVGNELRQRFRVVFVDEYQDTDPGQERLLQALAGQGRDLVVVGDPDQAIYAFRGAEVAGLLGFPERFRRADGEPAPVVSLGVCRRSGAELLAASRRVAERLPAPGLAADRVRAHRSLVAEEGAVPGTVEVRSFSSAGAEADAVADLLRREHLEHGTPWGEMAVLVRSAARSVPLLRRVLSAAGVPVEVAGDELPLAREPAVAPLLLALRVADAMRRPEHAAEVLTVELARELLLSPLGGGEPGELRRLGRVLRGADRQRAGEGQWAAPSGRLLRDALLEPGQLLEAAGRQGGSVARLARLLGRARDVLAAGEGPEAALWELWDGSAWPGRLTDAALAGGAAGRSADRDLDAVVALFAAVARAAERPHRAPAVGPLLDELEAQQIPGDTLAERAVRGDAVRLLTAHRSKGLEWQVVVVCSVQDGAWPDLRRRSSLLEPDRLAPPDEPELREPLDRGRLLADERRLFYVALTRARRRVVVTAVDSGEEDGERPSRFLDELGVDIAQQTERTAQPLSLAGLVGALRRASVDPGASPALRAAAATRLARLAEAVDGAGEPLVPAAHPDRWWGLAEPTASGTPLHPPGQPVPLSGTSVAGLLDCPLKWFLEHEVQAREPASTAMGFGGVLHALAHEVAGGRTPPDLDALMGRLDIVWGQLAYEAPWQSAQEHAAAKEALGRFLAWHAAHRERELVGSELRFELDLELEAGSVRLRGFLDRVELDAGGRVRVVDFKTGRTTPSGEALGTHSQLGIYQLAVREGALDAALAGMSERPEEGYQPGGAELVFLRLPGSSAAPGAPKITAQPALGAADTWVVDQLEAALRSILGEEFPPAPGERCATCAFRRCCPAQPDGRQVVP